MQVLTLTPFFPTAGDTAAGCFIAEPLAALEELGIRSRVIAVMPFYRKFAEGREMDDTSVWVKYPCLPGGIGLSSSGSLLYRRLLSLIKRIHQSDPIDIIHAHAALPCGHAATLISRELGVPSVVTVHGLDAYFTRQVSGLAGGFCRKVATHAYRSAKRVISVSGKVCEQVLDSKLSDVRTTVIYNGVDCERFYPAEDIPREPLILSVGNLIPSKGHALLLRSLAPLTQKIPGLRCEIIGDGPERSNLQQLCMKLGIAEHVHFLGNRDRDYVADAMRRCSVFALPSSYEGLGCVYLEAMSAAKPVIACRGQGIEEIIQDGSNGFLISPGDPEGLIDVLLCLLENESLRREIGERARLHVLANFTLDHQAARLAEVYRECVA